MKNLYTTLVVIFTVLVAIFVFQNAETVTVRFLTASVSLPRSLMLVMVYVLGMFTGGYVMNLVRGWMRGARKGTTRPGQPR